MLKIAPTPDEAYEICTKHAPNCDVIHGTSNVTWYNGARGSVSNNSSYHWTSSSSSNTEGASSSGSGSFSISGGKVIQLFNIK